MTPLNELEQDALTEIFNIGVGLAADALNQMLGVHVPLSVPVVELTSQHSAKQQFMSRETRPMFSIRQAYIGALTTDAILMFPHKDGIELARMMVGADLPLEQVEELQEDALAEIGNIILNAVISNLTSALDMSLEGTLPVVSLVSAGEVFAPPTPSVSLANEEAPVLALMIDFALSEKQVQGYLAFLLGVDSTEKLRSHLALAT
jgi:chemotaxis protein CheC